MPNPTLEHSFPDWHIEPVRVIQAGDAVFAVLLRATGSGRASGATVAPDLAHVWELRDGVAVRVREFYHWEEAQTQSALTHRSPPIFGQSRAQATRESEQPVRDGA